MACAGGPKVPDWAINEQGAAERATDAYLSGNSRVADAEWRRAREEVRRTARPDLLARLELARCAAQVAALDASPCSGYEAVAQDAAAPEQAYARYLRGAQQPADIALLPKVQQAVAAQQATGAAAALAAMEDPLSRLVAAGALAVRSPLPMAVVQQAVDTASAQGWRRALLAWLINQQRLAQEQGDTALAAQVQRRLDVLQATQK
ncbi:hypothetical protein [Comamonas odontotermitis]|uniref:hypothetical protein n=1 Tax=Comamonas odontotermitis TaxID=379895 RepID=UPI001CC67491|nr:hypothetical protein [Comamonas odontotermitis]UBB18182.1 hypothetical protein LAD35_05960 [Comamonas odontotermitis]